MFNTIKLSALAVACAIADFSSSNDAQEIITDDMVIDEVAESALTPQLPLCMDFDRFGHHLRGQA